MQIQTSGSKQINSVIMSATRVSPGWCAIGETFVGLLSSSVFPSALWLLDSWARNRWGDGRSCETCPDFAWSYLKLSEIPRFVWAEAFFGPWKCLMWPDAQFDIAQEPRKHEFLLNDRGEKPRTSVRKLTIKAGVRIGCFPICTRRSRAGLFRLSCNMILPCDFFSGFSWFLSQVWLAWSSSAYYQGHEETPESVLDKIRDFPKKRQWELAPPPTVWETPCSPCPKRGIPGIECSKASAL